MKHRTKRIVALAMASVMAADILLPTAALALTSGPSQPEVQGFSPIGANDLVNLFSGDMSYNIPLLDVEGYPINLAYSAGIGVDQEASWVGLGWSLNPGVVERHLRGVPDDFNGDQITREISMKDNITVGATVGFKVELFGKDLTDALSGSLSLEAQPSYNNYEGVQFAVGANVGLQSTLPGKSTFTSSLGVNSSSNGGVTMQPQIGVERTWANADRKLTGGLNFGLGLNSRQGMTNASFGTNLTYTKTRSAIKDDKGNVTGYRKTNASLGRNGPGRSFDLGQPTYSPQISVPMRNTSISARISFGAGALGAHPAMFYGGSYSKQEVATNRIARKAYGYLHLGAGQDDTKALLDFNREKDGPFSTEQAALPIASLTPDVFAVSGQNMSGSYRAFRDEVGHVFDALTVSSGSGGSVGGEVGVATGGHVGVDLKVNSMTTTSGSWTTPATARLRFKTSKSDPLDEHVFFREANEAVVERDSSLWVGFGRDVPKRFDMIGASAYNMRLTGALEGSAVPASNEKRQRDARGQVFSYLTHREVRAGLGLNPLVQPGMARSVAPRDHHISEITVTGSDGSRNIYGIPAYNLTQYDVTFAMGGGTYTEADESQPVPYAHNTDNTSGNKKGRDRFYSRSITPPYAYAFLLTAALSSDYSDVDSEPGPSPGDLGTYTRFNYELTQAAYPWRTPAGTDKARLDRGRGAVDHDDKASYVFGHKELWYLESIESRNLVAVFHRSERQDCKGILENGGPASATQQQLDSIKLYERSAYVKALDTSSPLPAPIKTVHFDYDYSLCPNTPNSVASGGGKLTLKRVYFTYGASYRGMTSPYVFRYPGVDGMPGTNRPYDMAATDRWGNYKPDQVNDGISALPNHCYPYAEQRPAEAGEYASAWALTRIDLPSGGSIKVVYEADDYAWVQNKRAHRMFKVAGIQPVSDGGAANLTAPSVPLRSVDESVRVFFKLPEEYQDDTPDPSEFTKDMGGQFYFRFKTRFHFKNGVDGFDYVSGHAPFEGNVGIVGTSPNKHGYITVTHVWIDEENPDRDVTPMYRAALEQARREYPSELFNPSDPDYDAGVVQLILAVTGSITQLFSFLPDLFNGPNKVAEGKVNKGAPLEDEFGAVRMGESWIRLSEPGGHKRGGGHRVRRVETVDRWEAMVDMGTDPALPGRTYGQEYEYLAENGMSSGVAAWEPGVGADENPWRVPQYGRVSASLNKDERTYQEEPFGESLYPSPTVGYARVTVRDIYPVAAAVAQQGTGRVVHEFYTAKDFPTIKDRTGIRYEQRRSKWNPLSLLKIKMTDNAHTSQGFIVETNDMHGKPLSTTVYPQPGGADETRPISSVRYEYATLNGRLVNTATTIAPDGTIARAQIGRHYEFLADMREYRSQANCGGMDLNTEIAINIFPVPIPIMLFNRSKENTAYRSGVFVKKVHRFGLLKRVVKVENGSEVSTENLAWDAHTGSVLLTKTTNEFNDPVYSMRFPAYWHYDGMGPAYRNIGATLASLNVSGGQATLPANAQGLFVPGDELALWPASGDPVKGWVESAGTGSVRVIDAQGRPIGANFTKGVKVLRSGRRNMQDVDMTNLTLLSDPLAGFSGNVFGNILQAQVVELEDGWRFDCGCVAFTGPEVNPFRYNRRGVWRLNREHAWLTERSRTIFDNNTDIRRDGVFTSFDPFYKLVNGRWERDRTGWTLVREVTEYSPRGQELENQDALGLYSSATFGHGGSLPKTVARNARYQDTGFESFEEGELPLCTDKHFRFEIDPGAEITGARAHAGRHSAKAVNGSSVRLVAGAIPCPAPARCALQLVEGVGEVLAVGGTPPYTFAYEILSGSPAIGMAGDGGIGIDGAGRVRVTVTDTRGCAATGTFGTIP